MRPCLSSVVHSSREVLNLTHDFVALVTSAFSLSASWNLLSLPDFCLIFGLNMKLWLCFSYKRSISLSILWSIYNFPEELECIPKKGCISYPWLTTSDLQVLHNGSNLVKYSLVPIYQLFHLVDLYHSVWYSHIYWMNYLHISAWVYENKKNHLWISRWDWEA